tara:strand:+ start:531 stop:800 length:270 start_codon:yes stop_codon:yes gene_type:complete
MDKVTSKIKKLINKVKFSIKEYKFKIKEIYKEYLLELKIMYKEYLFKFKTIMGFGSCECLPEGHLEPCDVWKKILAIGVLSFIIGVVLI